MKSDNYYGKKAEGYEAKRKPQLRWARENEIVEDYARKAGKIGRLIDVPCGTGRFLPLWQKLGVGHVTAFDASEDMQRIAKRKAGASKVTFWLGNAAKMDEFARQQFDVANCIRFLDLIDEPMMHAVVKELCSITRREIWCTIRLGEKYVPKSNTATHDRKKFMALISRCGFRVEESTPIFNAGWVVLRLMRKK